MCILAFVTDYFERFPLVLISNRDEQLGRGTRPLRLDSASGLIWAVDEVAGGSWMGVDPRSGRFAILTNCRRAPSAPLTRAADVSSAGEARCCHRERPALSTVTSAPPHSTDAGDEGCQGDAEWRGAAPLQHIVRFTSVVPVRAELADPAHPHAVTLTYAPPTSRGTLIRDFLMRGELPAATATDAYPQPPCSPLTEPFYAGYNLLTCRSLRSDDIRDGMPSAAAGPTLRYTTNRYGAEYGVPLAPRVVHTLQNSFLNNTDGEPNCRRLGQLLEAAMQEVVAPLNDAPTRSLSVADVATRLADACLCDRRNVDVVSLAHDSASPNASAIAATLASTNPLLGLSDAELQHCFGAKAAAVSPGVVDFTSGGAERVEAHLQANILKKPVRGHGTRVQSVVLVERVPVPATQDREGTAVYEDVIHFCQRDVSFVGEAQTCVGAPWIVFHIRADGSVESD